VRLPRGQKWHESEDGENGDAYILPKPAVKFNEAEKADVAFWGGAFASACSVNGNSASLQSARQTRQDFHLLANLLPLTVQFGTLPAPVR
jgi:hypothetical protein